MAIVAASGNGSAPSTAANRKNNSATVLHGGNATTSAGNPVTKIVTLRDLADDFGKSFGSKVLANDGTGAATTDRVGISGAFSTGTLAYNATATTWVMKGGNVSTTLAGSGNTGILSPGSDFNGKVRDNIHQTSGTYTLGSGNGVFDMMARPSTDITPNFTKGASAGDWQQFVAPSGAGDVPTVDQAATPTRAVPGELTYHFGALSKPTTNEYKAKDSFES